MDTYAETLERGRDLRETGQGKRSLGASGKDRVKSFRASGSSSRYHPRSLVLHPGTTLPVPSTGLTLPTHRHQLTILAADSGISLDSSSTPTCSSWTLTQLRPLPLHSFPSDASFPSVLLHLPMELSLPQAEAAQAQHLPTLAFLASVTCRLTSRIDPACLGFVSELSLVPGVSSLSPLAMQLTRDTLCLVAFILH